ncbi:hypothetical protein PGTUg99_002358 [Puccinia graminis f. sp. tritici]|uniref:Myb/SANT-like domain-containing protein n=1 Tax=Puccinia graminis f. sp. tritici TaxID=56615 RepID=A0A5B0P689_PUCGR|nr:hypothetical protein PGTUg99_002358 [Puccinia graminis f. sp. tritici]
MALQQIVGRQQLGPESWDATRSGSLGKRSSETSGKHSGEDGTQSFIEMDQQVAAASPSPRCQIQWQLICAMAAVYSVHYLLSQCDQVCFGKLTRRAELEADITIGPFSEDNSLSEARPSSKDDCSKKGQTFHQTTSPIRYPQKSHRARRGIYCFLAELFKSKGQQHRESDTNTRFDRLVRLSCTHTYRQFFSQHELRMIEDIIETRSQRWARAEAPTRTTQEETSVACTPTQLWTDDQRKSLLQIILNQPQLEFQTNTGNLQRLSWENLASIMNKRFNTKFHASGVKDQTDQIRQTFVDITFCEIESDSSGIRKKACLAPVKPPGTDFLRSLRTRNMLNFVKDQSSGTAWPSGSSGERPQKAWVDLRI